MRYLLKALLVVCLLAPMLPVLAQDESPPVPVEKAAYHWPIFRNDYVMLLRVYMRPGKGSNFHIHSLDQISVLVEAGANAGQIFGKERKRSPPRPGRAAVSVSPPSPRRPFTHRSTNTADDPFNNIVIALLKPRAGNFTPQARDVPGYSNFRQRARRGWRLNSRPGETAGPNHADRAGTARHHRRRRARGDHQGRDGPRAGAAVRRFLLAGAGCDPRDPQQRDERDRPGRVRAEIAACPNFTCRLATIADHRR